MRIFNWFLNLVERIRMPRGLLLLAVLVIVFLVVIFLAVYFFWQTSSENQSSAKALIPPNIETTVGGEGTPEYNQLVEGQNREKAEKAKATGNSHIDTPVGDQLLIQKEVSKDNEAIKSSIPKEKEPVQEVVMNKQPVVSQKDRRVPDKANSNKNYLADLKGLIARINPPLTEPLIAYVPDSSPSPKISESPVTEARLASDLAVGLKPGDLLYGVLDMAINSDLPAPVLATVVKGEFKGAKMLGSVSLYNESVLVSFNRLNLPDGSSVAMSALAVDPQTSSAAIAAKVDRHLLERWGSLIGASFMEGFGEALSSKEVKVYTSGDTVVESGSDKSYQDVALEALGKVGNRTATQIEKGFDRPATVKVKAGQAIGILIMEIKKS